MKATHSFARPKAEVRRPKSGWVADETSEEIQKKSDADNTVLNLRFFFPAI